MLFAITRKHGVGSQLEFVINSLSSLIPLTTTSSFENRGNDYFSQLEISWCSQQALTAASPHQASLQSSFMPVFEAPHSSHSSESGESSTWSPQSGLILMWPLKKLFELSYFNRVKNFKPS